jgi:hypothetical protein
MLSWRLRLSNLEELNVKDGHTSHSTRVQWQWGQSLRPTHGRKRGTEKLTQAERKQEVEALPRVPPTIDRRVQPRRRKRAIVRSVADHCWEIRPVFDVKLMRAYQRWIAKRTMKKGFTEFERTKQNVHTTTLQHTWEIQVLTPNATLGEILHNQRNPNSQITRSCKDCQEQSQTARRGGLKDLPKSHALP